MSEERQQRAEMTAAQETDELALRAIVIGNDGEAGARGATADGERVPCLAVEQRIGVATTATPDDELTLHLAPDEGGAAGEDIAAGRGAVPMVAGDSERRLAADATTTMLTPLTPGVKAGKSVAAPATRVPETTTLPMAGADMEEAVATALETDSEEPALLCTAGAVGEDMTADGGETAALEATADGGRAPRFAGERRRAEDDEATPPLTLGEREAAAEEVTAGGEGVPALAAE